MKRTFKEIGGTSFHDTVINCSVTTLKKVLGPPKYELNDGEEKVNFEWAMETDSGDVFTVYDYKEYRSLNENEVIEWHIGGHSKVITEQAKREIQEAIAKS
jgi:hypothetical protein